MAVADSTPEHARAVVKLSVLIPAAATARRIAVVALASARINVVMRRVRCSHSTIESMSSTEVRGRRLCTGWCARPVSVRWFTVKRPGEDRAVTHPNHKFLPECRVWASAISSGGYPAGSGTPITTRLLPGLTMGTTDRCYVTASATVVDGDRFNRPCVCGDDSRHARDDTRADGPALRMRGRPRFGRLAGRSAGTSPVCAGTTGSVRTSASA